MADPSDLLSQLRDADRGRYAAVLYARREVRDVLAILHLFDLQLAGIRDLVSEPMPGEIRLQWWREVIGGERAGEAQANPLARDLLAAIDTENLPQAALEMMIEGRIADLYDDPFATTTDLEAYFGQTRSMLFQLLVQVCDAGSVAGAADASGHAGCAWGAAHILLHAARDRARGKVAIPEDILAATGGTAASWLTGDDEAFVARAIEAFSQFGRDHLARALGEIGGLPAAARSAYLPLALCSPVFARAEKLGSAVASQPVTVSPIAYQWHLLRLAWKL